MGCCVSKCGPKKHPLQQCYHVQDKLVISQAAAKTPKLSMSNRISPSPPSPIADSTSSPCFTAMTAASSCTSLSTGSSSISCSKDRSFSNEFLWSCMKENPHVIRINSLKERSDRLLPSQDVHVHKFAELASKQSTPQRVITGSTSQKRVRSNSPTLQTRQKSFRREPDQRLLMSSSYNSLSNRALIRSPSPSRRFNMDSGRWGLAANSTTPKELMCSKRFVGSKVSPAATSISSSLKRESLRLASPYLMNSNQLRSCLRNSISETRIHRITSKIDEVAVEKALAHPDADPVAMEDIDNPLISLDCFIFL